MNFSLRPPREGEWRICRMLLPETFSDISSRHYLVAVRDEAPHVLGAVSFRRTANSLTYVRLHVVPSFRRSGVGSQIVSILARGGTHLEGTADVMRERGAGLFCERNSFQRVDAITTVEAEMAEMRTYIRRLRERMRLPPNVRLVPLSAAPVEQVARLHTDYVAQEGTANRWRALMAHSPGMAISPVVMMDGQIAGILLGELEGSTAVVRTRVVAPGHHGAWINALLLAEALDTGWAHGARRTRFSYNDSNRDTRKLAIRFRADVVSEVTQFVRGRIAPGTALRSD